MENISLIGIDIAKRWLQICAVNRNGIVVLSKKVGRADMLSFTANLKPTVIAMEACSGSNYWGREFEKQGHRVKLINARHVKPFVKHNKDDRADAQAITEAARRPGMKFIPVKTIDQLEIQALHRIRRRWIKARTALGNQIRGFLAEYGVVIPVGHATIKRLGEHLERNAEKLTEFACRHLLQSQEEWLELTKKLAGIKEQLEKYAKQHPICQLVTTIPGVGPLISTAAIAAVGDASRFKNGREFAAYFGLVPKHTGTGGKNVVLGTSKRGDRYLRLMLIQGAHVIARWASKKEDAYHSWCSRVVERRGKHKAVVAIANKNARIIWAVMKTQQPFNQTLAA